MLSAGVVRSKKLLAENAIRAQRLHTQCHVVLCWTSRPVGQFVHTVGVARIFAGGLQCTLLLPEMLTTFLVVIFLQCRRKPKRGLRPPPTNYNNWPSIFWRPFLVVTLALAPRTIFPIRNTRTLSIREAPDRGGGYGVFPPALFF